jgi:hypothetical protein
MCSDQRADQPAAGTSSRRRRDEAGDEFGRFAVVAGGTVSVDAGLMPPR